MKNIFDVTIIGGGPAGLYSAFYSGLRELKTKIIEYQPHLGGKLHLYPEKMIWDVGGQIPISGEKLSAQLVQQGLTFDPKVVLDEKVESIVRDENGIFILRTLSGQEHFSKTIIIAVGGGILTPIKLELEGADRFEVSNLSYTVKSMQRFKDKTIVISGGGNSAIDWANELEPIAKKVYVAYRKDALNGHESQITQLKNSSVTCYFNTTISKLIASENHDAIESVALMNSETGEVSYVDVDEVVINHGYEQDAELLKNSELDIKIAEKYYIDGTSLSESSVEGIYAAGDILYHPGKLQLIAGTFQDAANAVNRAKKYLQPDASQVAMVSSHNDLFIEKNKELMKQSI